MSYFEFPHTRTYDSDLGWLIKTVKELSEEYETLVSWMNTHKSEYQELLTRVIHLENSIDSFESEIERRFAQLTSDINRDFNILSNNLTSSLNRQIHDALSEINVNFGEVRQWLSSLESQLNRQYFNLSGDIKAHYDLSKAYTDSKIQALIDSIPDLTTVNVFNPVKGYVTSIQIAIDDLYDLCRADALTAREYDDLGLTASEYDALELTALEYDLYGRRLLEQLGIYKNPWHYMYSPFSGEYVPISQVVLELSYLHQSDTLTASEYDAKDLTADDFDALLLSAYDYDWHGKSLIA